MAAKPVKVSQLNAYIKRILSTDPLLGNLSVVGEISNLKFHGTGHVYFTLKDEGGKISCFLSADRMAAMRYDLAEGMEIVATGYIYLYEKGGSYSLNIRDIEVSGQGNLSIAFEKCKERLAAEGLFDVKYKKSLPAFPKRIALVTSDTGAAVEDMLKIITTRNQLVDVLVYPVLVQGPGAAAEIAGAIGDINAFFPETDIIITGRGGGSIEELWAFNEEIVARSIFASKIPVISAVGHEIDVTIADFVADKRAETPTAAAQMAVPDLSELRAYADTLYEGLFRSARRLLEERQRLLSAYRIASFQKNFEDKIALCQVACDAAKGLLEARSPANIMALGYGAILNTEGQLTGSASDFSPGDGLTVVFPDGRALCRVNEIRGDQFGGG